MTQVELTDEDAELFKSFREHQEHYKIMLDAGIFAFKGGSVVIHYNPTGLIMKIERNAIPYIRYKAA